MRRRRSENITPVKGIADPAQVIGRVVQVDSLHIASLVQHVAEYPIVWRDEMVIARMNSNRDAGTADARIDHHQKDSLCREKAIIVQQCKSALPDVLRLNRMG